MLEHIVIITLSYKDSLKGRVLNKNIMEKSHNAITKKTKETLDFIKEFTKENGRQPQVKEIAENFDIALSTAHERKEKATFYKGACPMCGFNKEVWEFIDQAFEMKYGKKPTEAEKIQFIKGN